MLKFTTMYILDVLGYYTRVFYYTLLIVGLVQPSILYYISGLVSSLDRYYTRLSTVLLKILHYTFGFSTALDTVLPQ